MLRNPEFPPLLTGHAVAASDEPVWLAAEGAARGEYGAGDFLWSLAETHVRAAVVLEPECQLARALQMAPVMMVAIGDALGAIGPPNLALMYRWPLTLLANGGVIGEVTLVAPEATRLSDVPDHVVLGFSIALILPPHVHDAPGLSAGMTALHEEGCGDLDRTHVVEAVARHFLARVDGWEHEGFGGIHADFLGRMDGKDQVIELEIGGKPIGGRMIGIDEEGGLLLDGSEGFSGVGLAEILAIGK